MKLGIIGAGNIATAIIGGSIKSGNFKGGDIWVFDIFPDKSEQCREKFGVNIAESTDFLASESDVLILAVKPKDFPSLLTELNEALKKNDPLLISMAAGLSIEYISSFLSYNARVARLMTNINALIGEAMTAYCVNERVNEDDEKLVDTLCGSIGVGVKLDETYFPLFGVLAGCGPAFAYMYIEEYARAGVKIGLNKQLSLKIAAQTVLGSAKLIMESDAHPYELIDRVCTPGGTTIEGIAALKECGFDNAIIKAVDSSLEKDRRLEEAKKIKAKP
jgi:pyrroline-5-carboxylate reductase